jgi:hypothetical protein
MQNVIKYLVLFANCAATNVPKLGMKNACLFVFEECIFYAFNIEANCISVTV